MYLSSELIVGCVHMFATMFEAEQRASFAPRQRRSLLGGYQGHDSHDALLVLTKFFKKEIPTTVSRPIAQAKGFLTEAQSREK
jgi:hypothetical protein